jgi:DNA helicase-2/ATP-dependent DNA helicase PcrA
LYLKDCVEGFRTNHAVRHVFIDEAQDYSPFQFAFVRRMFPRARLTVLGDPNQAIYGHAAASEGTDALSTLSGSTGNGEDAAETIALTRTYRSTKQIVELTRRLIAGGEAVVPFNREGPLPTVRRAADGGELIAIAAGLIRALQQRGRRTIAVIGKTAAECREAYKALQALVPLRLIGSDTAAFEAGTMVIPSYLAKGVEFDAVIVFDGSEQRYGRESERKLFYTVCTRAMHELHILYAGRMSPFLAAVPSSLYVAE